MIKTIKYVVSTRKHFKPHKTNFVNYDDLSKILAGKVANPYKLKNFGNVIDYSYFIVSSRWLPELNDRKERRFKQGDMENILLKSEWFGKFFCESPSEIVVPHKYTIRLYGDGDSMTNSIMDYTAEDEWTNRFDNGKRILVSDIGINKILDMLKKSYPQN